MRRPPVVLGMALVTCLALLVAVLLILFSVNPKASHNRSDIQHAQIEIRTAQVSEHALVCAVVQLIANTYRFRSLTPSGEVEPVRHFLTRIQAQQQLLRLARGSECKSAPGFPPVGLQVKRALHQIQEILHRFGPKLRKPVSHGVSHLSPGGSDKQGGFLRGFEKPSKTGVDENGVPAKLHDELTPSAPTKPLRHHHAQLRAEEQPEAIEAPVVPKSWAEAEDNPQQAHAEVVKGPPELIPPVQVEASQEEIKVDIGLGE